MTTPKGNKTPQQILEREFTKVNRKYFKDQIVAEVALEVPPKNVAVSVQNPSKPVPEGSHVEAQIRLGLDFAIKGDYEKAVSQIRPFAERNYKSAVEAMVTIERNRHGDYLYWAKILNNMDKPVRKFPAACIDRDIGRIFIHPMIGQAPCPRFVMSYLIHHECLHMVVPPTEESAHPPAFMERERAFPKREQARQWLKQNNFPVVAA